MTEISCEFKHTFIHIAFLFAFVEGTIPKCHFLVCISTDLEFDKTLNYRLYSLNFFICKNRVNNGENIICISLRRCIEPDGSECLYCMLHILLNLIRSIVK